MWVYFSLVGICKMAYSKEVVYSALRFLIGIIVVVGLSYFLFQSRDALGRTLEIDKLDLFFLLTSIFANWLVSSWMQKGLLVALGKNVPLGILFCVHSGAGLLNHLPLRVGLLYRARFLKKYNQLEYTQYASIYTVMTLVMLIMSGLVGIVYAAGSSLYKTQLGLVFTCFLLVVIVLSIIPLVVRLPNLDRSGRFAAMWNRIAAARDPRLVSMRLLLFLGVGAWMTVLLTAVRFYIAFMLLDMDVGFGSCLLYGAVGNLSFLLSITPAGIGVYELGIGALAVVSGISLEQGVLGAAIVRGAHILCYLIVGGPSLFLLNKRKYDSNQKQDG
jgi:uncharacterized membrane protein YbhN (UPF0104 family)